MLACKNTNMNLNTNTVVTTQYLLRSLNGGEGNETAAEL